MSSYENYTQKSGNYDKTREPVGGHASIQLTLDSYSHWMPSMGRNTADGMDEALG